jgi:hypothetical protein
MLSAARLSSPGTCNCATTRGLQCNRKCGEISPFFSATVRSKSQVKRWVTGIIQGLKHHSTHMISKIVLSMPPPQSLSDLRNGMDLLPYGPDQLDFRASCVASTSACFACVDASQTPQHTQQYVANLKTPCAALLLRRAQARGH